MKVVVRFLNGEEISVEVVLDTTMGYIKEVIEQTKSGCKVVLNYDGMTAADGFTVQDFELEDGAVLTGVLAEAEMKLHVTNHGEVTVPGHASVADLKKACGFSIHEDAIHFSFRDEPLPEEGRLSEAGVVDGAKILMTRPKAPSTSWYDSYVAAGR